MCRIKKQHNPGDDRQPRIDGPQPAALVPVVRAFPCPERTSPIPTDSRWFTTAASAATLVAMSVFALSASAGDESFGSGSPNAFQFGQQDMESLQFSRKPEDHSAGSEMQTELSFKLSPGTFDFSSAGAFGLSGVFANPELAISSRPSGKYRVHDSFPELHDGLSYSAGVKIEHEDQDLPDTAYVSSGQLGLSYGRLGQVWYSGVDLSIGQFSAESPIEDATEVLSLDITTGRKLGWTGVGANAPLWLFSLQGNFDIQSGNEVQPASNADWYLNPSLFWNSPEFTFSAQLQVPVDSDLWRDFEEPDYRLRAIFEKQFR
ncbi:MAG: hypothetical protein KTR33_05645 [Gammaproteobacteria bacterium]|nr:hypothetical protein [Gammaproteobacteria bacterium]